LLGLVDLVTINLTTAEDGSEVSATSHSNLMDRHFCGGTK